MADIPTTEVYFADTSDDLGPFGAKSMSESPYNPVAAGAGQRDPPRGRRASVRDAVLARSGLAMLSRAAARVTDLPRRPCIDTPRDPFVGDADDALAVDRRRRRSSATA